MHGHMLATRRRALDPRSSIPDPSSHVRYSLLDARYSSSHGREGFSMSYERWFGEGRRASIPFNGTFVPLKASVLIALGSTMRVANHEGTHLGDEHMPMNCRGNSSGRGVLRATAGS